MLFLRNTLGSRREEHPDGEIMRLIAEKTGTKLSNGRKKISQICQFSLDANIGNLVEIGKRARGCCGCRRSDHEADTVPEYLPEEFLVRRYSRSEVVREETEEWSNAKS